MNKLKFLQTLGEEVLNFFLIFIDKMSFEIESKNRGFNNYTLKVNWIVGGAFRKERCDLTYLEWLVRVLRF